MLEAGKTSMANRVVKKWLGAVNELCDELAKQWMAAKNTYKKSKFYSEADIVCRLYKRLDKRKVLGDHYYLHTEYNAWSDKKNKRKRMDLAILDENEKIIFGVEIKYAWYNGTFNLSVHRLITQYKRMRKIEKIRGAIIFYDADVENKEDCKNHLKYFKKEFTKAITQNTSNIEIFYVSKTGKKQIK